MSGDEGGCSTASALTLWPAASYMNSMRRPYADVLHATKNTSIDQGSQSHNCNSGRPLGFRCRLL